MLSNSCLSQRKSSCKVSLNRGADFAGGNVPFNDRLHTKYLFILLQGDERQAGESAQYQPYSEQLIAGEPFAKGDKPYEYADH